MKKSYKVKNIIIIFIIIYLCVSSIYILFNIDFFKNNEMTVGMGFSNTTNLLRLFMGIPKTYTTYNGVSPIFLLEVVIKMILAVILLRYIKKAK